MNVLLRRPNKRPMLSEFSYFSRPRIASVKVTGVFLPNPSLVPCISCSKIP